MLVDIVGGSGSFWTRISKHRKKKAEVDMEIHQIKMLCIKGAQATDR